MAESLIRKFQHVFFFSQGSNKQQEKKTKIFRQHRGSRCLLLKSKTYSFLSFHQRNTACRRRGSYKKLARIAAKCCRILIGHLFLCVCGYTFVHILYTYICIYVGKTSSKIGQDYRLERGKQRKGVFRRYFNLEGETVEFLTIRTLGKVSFLRLYLQF